jgi:hypothetical protein
MPNLVRTVQGTNLGIHGAPAQFRRAPWPFVAGVTTNGR